jgi:altronate hydrolase
MKQNNLKVHPDDNVIVALTDLKKNDSITNGGETIIIQDDVKAKHKFTTVSGVK